MYARYFNYNDTWYKYNGANEFNIWTYQKDAERAIDNGSSDWTKVSAVSVTTKQ